LSGLSLSAAGSDSRSARAASYAIKFFGFSAGQLRSARMGGGPFSDRDPM
jgi:hypothetical protein